MKGRGGEGRGGEGRGGEGRLGLVDSWHGNFGSIHCPPSSVPPVEAPKRLHKHKILHPDSKAQ